MAELADAHGSGPCESNFMQVQVLLPAPKLFTPVNTMFTGVLLYLNHPKTRKNTYRS